MKSSRRGKICGLVSSQTLLYITCYPILVINWSYSKICQHAFYDEFKRFSFYCNEYYIFVFILYFFLTLKKWIISFTKVNVKYGKNISYKVWRIKFTWKIMYHCLFTEIWYTCKKILFCDKVRYTYKTIKFLGHEKFHVVI